MVLEAAPRVNSVGGDLGTIGVGIAEPATTVPALDESSEEPVVITGTSQPAQSRKGSAWDGPASRR